ncbi:replicative DNA helicase [Tissierella pigra]|uniref:Replicative DNA helicase n=1 Tax=Tissierella pigra TaxID=2607614 RepID=A0A6N7XJJ1_9FIRM|nr:replicative DNA helicase [Tissierella pigra]MBU5424830.1 replicative DNA helicase [Tissierella pigra]MSU02229.1 replicative DNA helicase [Tissierella pigra]
MGISIKNITENYRERMERLVLFDPLYELKRKTGKDNSGNIIDYYGLGLLTLLFFFENMLIRNKKAGVLELTEFLSNLTYGQLDLSYEDYVKMSREIIQVFRPSSGKRNSREFYNWETGKDEIIQYSILKASDFDSKSNLQYYKLDEQGLELIFATKEFFSEFQLSINQLILRKQLEKGEFAGALRQIDEMRMDVRHLQEKIYSIKHEIQRNIISDETYKRYETIVDDIHFRLNRENEEFEELKLFIGETKNRLEYEIHKDKMEKAYGLVLRIERELGEVHYEHRNLLLESIEMKTTALNAAQESLYYVGIDSFNFKEQITSKLLSIPLPLEASRNLAAPFLYLEKAELWSPLAVFAKQGIIKKGTEDRGRTFIDPLEEGEIQEDIKIQQRNYEYIMEIILRLIDNENHISLEEVVNHIIRNEDESILNHRSFYDFWLLLHYNSPIKMEIEENQNLMLEKVIKLLEKDYTQLEVVEINGKVQPNTRYTIRNMKLSLEVKNSDI